MHNQVDEPKFTIILRASGNKKLILQRVGSNSHPCYGSIFCNKFAVCGVGLVFVLFFKPAQLKSNFRREKYRDVSTTKYNYFFSLATGIYIFVFSKKQLTFKVIFVKEKDPDQHYFEFGNPDPHRYDPNSETMRDCLT